MKLSARIVWFNFVLLVFLLASILLSSCASSKTISSASFDMRIIAEADSLFEAGDYEKARKKYEYVRNDGANATARALSQYRLAYTYIFHRNPNTNYQEAQLEFSRFITEYPYHHLVGDASNYLRLLDQINTVTDLLNKEKTVKKTVEQMVDPRAETLLNNLIDMQKAYFKCGQEADSLRNAVKLLEGVISEIDRIK